jgi:hypothetical protein
MGHKRRIYRQLIWCSRHPTEVFEERPWITDYELSRGGNRMPLVCLACVRADRERLRLAVWQYEGRRVQRREEG